MNEDIRIAEAQRANEIANFGKDNTLEQSPTFDWNPPIELLDTRPERFELVPIGPYNGGELLPGAIILDDSYIIHIQVINPDYDCKVIIS